MSEFDVAEVEFLAGLVVEERAAQHKQWGEQNHPSVYSENMRRWYERNADAYKGINAARVASERLTWDGILLEEVFEALCETDPNLRIGELIQVAAVALAEVEYLNRLIERQTAEPLADEDDE